MTFLWSLGAHHLRLKCMTTLVLNYTRRWQSGTRWFKTYRMRPTLTLKRFLWLTDHLTMTIPKTCYYTLTRVVAYRMSSEHPKLNQLCHEVSIKSIWLNFFLLTQFCFYSYRDYQRGYSRLTGQVLLTFTWIPAVKDFSIYDITIAKPKSATSKEMINKITLNKTFLHYFQK